MNNIPDITEDDLKLPFNEFAEMILDLYDTKTFTKIFPVKLRIDSKNDLLNINGDGSIVLHHKTISYSIAVSHEKITADKYRIFKLKPQSDYYLLCFVTKQGKTQFYFVPKDKLLSHPALHFNAQGVAFINGEDIEWLFKKINILSGTSYNSVLSLLNNAIAKPRQNTTVVPRIKLRKKFKVIYITGRTHSDLIANFITAITPEYAIGIIAPSYFNKEPSKYRKIKIGDYYLCNIFSVRDMTNVIISFNHKQHLYHATLQTDY